MVKKGEKLSPELRAKMAEGRKKGAEKREAEAIAAATEKLQTGKADFTGSPLPGPDIHISNRQGPVEGPLTPAERRELETEKRELENLQGGVGLEGKFQDPGFTSTVDQGSVSKRLTDLGNVLDRRTPGQLSPVEADRKWARVKELEGKITPGMPTMNEYFPTATQMRDNAGLVGRGVQQNRWEEGCKPEILEWKALKRELVPDDPNAANVETLRPGRGQRSGLGALAPKIQSIGWDPPELTETERDIRILRNLDPELVAANFGVTVDEVLRIQGKLEVATA